jgi:hypothetical protein
MSLSAFHLWVISYVVRSVTSVGSTGGIAETAATFSSGGVSLHRPVFVI